MVGSGVSPDGLPEFEDASETADSTVESAVSSGWELATHVPLPATFVMSTAGSHFNIGWPVQIPLTDASALHASHLAGDQQYPLQAMCARCAVSTPMAAALQSPAPATREVLVGPQRIWQAQCATCLTSDFILYSSVQQESPDWKSSAAALSRSLLVSKASPTLNKSSATTSFVQESPVSGTVNPFAAFGPPQMPGQSQLVPMTSSV